MISSLAACTDLPPSSLTTINQQINAACWNLDHPCRECVRRKITALEAAGFTPNELRVQFGTTYSDEEQHVTLQVRYYGSYYVLDNRDNRITGDSRMGVLYTWRVDGPEWAIVSAGR